MMMNDESISVCSVFSCALTFSFFSFSTCLSSIYGYKYIILNIRLTGLKDQARLHTNKIKLHTISPPNCNLQLRQLSELYLITLCCRLPVGIGGTYLAAFLILDCESVCFLCILTSKLSLFLLTIDNSSSSWAFSLIFFSHSSFYSLILACIS